MFPGRDETFTGNLALTAPLTGGRLSDTNDTGAGTITNDDTATYSISDATVTEGGDLSFTVSLSNPVDVDTTVNLTFSDGTTSAGDFDHTLVPVTFLAGNNTAQVILIPTVADNTVEADETFTANLALTAPLIGGRLSDTTDTGAGTITNDDTATYSISDATVTEGGDLSFTVSLSNPVDVDTTVNLTFSDGTTSAGDFDHTLVPVTFLAGNNTAQVILIPTVADNTVEADETFTANLALSAPLTGGRLSDTSDTGAGTITNDDTATYSISDATVTEGGDLSFTVSLSNPVDVDTTVNLTFSDGTTSAGDFDHTLVPVTFLAGNNTAQVILVPTVADNTVEADETFTANLALSAPLTGGRLSNTSDTGAGTITNDDTATYSITNATVTEGGNLSFTVSLSNPVDVNTTVNLTFTDGTTSAGDFDHTLVPVTFLAGNNSPQVIVLAATGDNLVEDDEAFTVDLALSAPLAGGRLSDTSDTGTGTILNDDTATYSISDASVSEGGNLSFTVSLSNPVDVDTTVNVTFADGTTAAGDFNHATVPVTFLAGNNTAQVILVATVVDNLVEADETLTASLALTAPLAGARLSDTTDTGAGTILNDDIAIYTVSDATVTEGGDLSFTVSLSNPVDVDTTVNLTFADGSTSAGDFDHTLIPVTFLAGTNTAQVFLVPTVADNTVEADETFTANLALTAPLTGGRLSDTTDTGTGTITNDDTATYSITDSTVTEGGNLSFTVALSNPVDIDTTVNLTFTDGSTSTNDFDHTLIPVTFMAGNTTAQVIVVSTVADNTVEADETFTVNLSLSPPLTGGRLSDTTDTGAGAITNDDTATYSISDATVTEGGNLSFTVSLSNPVDIDTTVNLTFTDGSTSANDFNHTPVGVTFLAGNNTAQVILIPTVADTTVEGDETLSVQLALSVPLTGGRFSDTSDTGNATILNDDTSTLVISNPTVTEGDSGVTIMTFTVTSPNAVQGGFTVAFSVADITANSTDYSVVTVSPLVFAGTAGEIQTITVNVNGDTLSEADETLSVTLGAVIPVPPVAAASIITGDVGIGTIENDDTVTFTINNAIVNEGAGFMVFNLVADHSVDIDLVIDVTFTNGTATGGTDFDNTVQHITFVAGETAKQVVVPITDDNLVEGLENFTLSLSTTTPLGGREVILTDTGVGSITNNDVATFTINDVTVSEGAGSLVFNLVTDKPLDVDVTIDVTFTSGSATGGGIDFTSTTQQITFLAGQTSRPVSVTINDDNLVEASESFGVTLSTATPLLSGRAVDLSDHSTGTIADNDTANFTIDDVTVNEGDGTLVFNLVSDKPFDIDVTIDVAFAGGAATGDGADYDSTTQHITFLAGETSKQVTVAINDDSIVEATESFTASLSTKTSLGDRQVNSTEELADRTIIIGDQGTGTITDNDTATFTVNNATAGEAAGALLFNLVTDKPLDIDITIDVTFTSGTATGGGTDFVSTTQHITILAGQTSQQVSVAINNDNLAEATETFTAALSTSTPLGGRSVDTSDTGTGTITDNDTASFTIDDVTVAEGTGTLVFTLSTDKPLDIDVTIDVTFTGVSASGGGVDFTSTTQQIIFLAGQTTQPVSVPINNDAIVESTETFTAGLSTTTPLGGRSINTSDTSTGTITDNDVATVSVSRITDGAESNSPTNGKFRISLSAISSTDTVVNYSVSGTATAGAGSDYSPLTGTVTIPAGQMSVDVDVAVLNDAVVESTETVILTLSGFGEHDPEITLNVTPATVNITDNDQPTITSGATATFAENTSIAVVVLDVDADSSLIAPGHTLSYSLSGPDAGLFNIDSVTGQITFKSSPNVEAPADQGTNNVYNVTVTVTADTAPTQAATQDLTITVTPVNDVTPVFIDASPTFSLPENSAVNTVVGSVQATDGDLPAQNLTYAIVGGNASGAFTINPATGQITVANSGPLNFEAVNSFTLTVRVTDNTPVARTADATVVVNLTNVSEGPSIVVPNTPQTYHLGQSPALVTPDAVLVNGDIANPNYDGAQLRVSIASGRSKKDKLGITSHGSSAGQISTRGHKVFYGSTQIGKFTGGKGGHPDLVVTLNGNASSAAVSNLLRRLNFEAKEQAGTTRTVHIQITDIAGVDTNVATRDIAVLPGG